VVVVKEGASVDPADLIGFCKERIGGYKCPRSVDVRTEPLPMSGAGKILKRELREPYWKGYTKAVN
jgi:long-chain acyl-CoA synthetase